MTTANAAMGKLRKSWSYFKWLYSPFGKMSAKDVYELLSTNALSRDGLFLNFGYWEEARTIDDACADMARLLARTAKLGPADDIVDVGFGFAEQDLLWVNEFGVRHITGLNITPTQVSLARERVRERGLESRISLLDASATSMPLEDGAFDKVVGLECAFHFHTREDFFREAFRVLRAGGRLALVDATSAPPAEGRFARQLQNFSWKVFAKQYSVPCANRDPRERYAAKLSASGFTNVRVESIWDHVFPGFHNALKTDREILRRMHPLARLSTSTMLGLDPRTAFGAFDYVVVSADKPA